MAYRVSARKGQETVASFVTGSRAPAMLAVMALVLGLLAALVPAPPSQALTPFVIGLSAFVCLMTAIYTFLSFVVRVRIEYDGATDALSVERSTGLKRTVEIFQLQEVREATVRAVSLGTTEVTAACLVLSGDRVVPLALDPAQDARRAEKNAVDRLQSWLAAAR